MRKVGCACNYTLLKYFYIHAIQFEACNIHHLWLLCNKEASQLLPTHVEYHKWILVSPVPFEQPIDCCKDCIPPVPMKLMSCTQQPSWLIQLQGLHASPRHTGIQRIHLIIGSLHAKAAVGNARNIYSNRTCTLKADVADDSHLLYKISRPWVSLEVRWSSWSGSRWNEGALLACYSKSKEFSIDYSALAAGVRR